MLMPSTVDTTIKIGMPLDEFIEAQEIQPFELIDGERIDRMPNFFGHSWYIRWLFLLLYRFTTENQLGEIFQETMYAQHEGKKWIKGSRIPDLMFYGVGKIEAFKQEHEDWRTIPLFIPPLLTIEVISPSERYTDIVKKVNADLANGVKLIWAIDIESQTVTVYYAGHITILNNEDTLDGNDILPEFQLMLRDLFAAEA
jgi:Uma2 family endonuclease